MIVRINNMAYKIVNMWTPSSMYPYKSPYAMQPTSITVHNTGNVANARNEVAYMNNNYNYVSYHVAIDEKEAVQAIPFNRNAFAAGDGIGLNSGNRTSIHIEICYSMDNGYSGAKSARYKKPKIMQHYISLMCLNSTVGELTDLNVTMTGHVKIVHTKCMLLIAIKRLKT